MKTLLNDKDEVRYGFGFLKFNIKIKLTIYPFDFVLLPFCVFTKYKEPKYNKWYFTFRWLMLFITAFKKV